MKEEEARLSDFLGFGIVIMDVSINVCFNAQPRKRVWRMLTVRGSLFRQAWGLNLGSIPNQS